MLSRPQPLAPLHSARFYELLLDNSRNMVFVKDRGLNIIYANQAFLELYPPEMRASVVGAPSAENFADIEATVFNAEDRKALDEGFSEIVEEITDYRGNIRVLQTQKIRIHDEQGRVCVLGIATDITQQAAREKTLATSNIALENFAAVAAHDLRSPLSALVSSLSLIENDKGSSLSALSRKYVTLMTACLGGLMDQITTLLAANKIDNENQDMRSECDLSVLLEEVRFGLSSHIVAARAKVLSSALPRLSVNKSMFRQLIHNLIENSLKYRSERDPIIILRHTDRGDCHEFSIEDNGLGVSPENREKIFGLYQQADGRSDGYGIGLSLCRRIVEMHGGKLWLDEKFAPGCRICFSIPTP